MTPPLRALLWVAVSTRPQANEEEKFSIPQQIADGTAFALANGLTLVDTLIVPGHSRSYRDLYRLAEHARAEGIDAFDRLIAHLERCDFDVFICRDANRFARRASLLHYIVESIIEDCHARLYSLNDSFWVDADTMDLWVTMQGYKVRAEVKWLVRAAREGLKKRAARGLTTTRVPFSHLLIRDDRLKPVRVEVDESRRRLFDDLFTLIVTERAPFVGIERALFERFGHAAKDGRPYGDNMMYHFLYHPLTWGRTVYGLSPRSHPRTYGAWVFDPAEPPPEGVAVDQGEVTPVYTGAQGEALKAELSRRKRMTGNRRPGTARMFSGLFGCAVCGYTLNVRTNPDGRGGRRAFALQCGVHAHRFQHRPACDQAAYLPLEPLRLYVDAFLRDLIATRDFGAFTPDTPNVAAQVAQVAQERAQAMTLLDNLIRLQAAAHPSTQAAYQRRIDAAGQQLEALERRARDLDALLTRQQRNVQTVTAALERIAPTLDTFWQLPEPAIHQHLHAVMGGYRFMVRDGEVEGIAPMPRRQRRKPKAG